MKKRFSFSYLLHKDKLMMVVSLILAIIIWVLVVYDQGNTEERVISGVPVSVTLTPYASEDLKLRIVDGADAVATVRVEGSRSAVGMLSAQDITVTADTGSVLKEGTYKLPLRVTASGNCKILGVVGDDGSSSTISITCDVWSEKPFPLTADNVVMTGLTLADSEKMAFGTPSPSGAAIQEGSVIVSGPKSGISRIVRVAAIISEEEQMSETTSFTAELIAYDAYDRPVDSVTFLNAEDGKVNVVVPVMGYHKEDVALVIKNAPTGLAEKVTLSQQAVELWAIPSELEEYLSDVRNGLVVDFDFLRAEGKDITIPLELKKTSSVRPLSNSETLNIALDLSSYTNKLVTIPLTVENVEVKNCPDGYVVELEQNMLPNVVVCGTRTDLKNLKMDQLRVVVDAGGLSAGHYTLNVRVEFTDAVLWTYYGAEGYEIQLGIVPEE